MGKSFQGWIGKVGTVALGGAAINNDKFFGLLGSLNLGINGATALSTVANQGDFGAPGHVTDFAGTIRNFYVKMKEARNAAITYTVRVNGVLSNCKVEVASAQSGNVPGTGEVEFVAGDYVDVAVETAVAGTPGVLGGAWCEMDTVGGHFGVYVSPEFGLYSGDIRTSNEKGGLAAGIDYYAEPIAGRPSTNLSLAVVDATPTTPPPSRLAVWTDDNVIAAAAEQRVRVAGAFTSGRMYVSSNTAGVGGTPRTATFGLRINGVDSAALYELHNSAPGPETGWIETTTEVAVADGDDVCYSIVPYSAVDAYAQPPGPNTRTNGQLGTYSRALNFRCDPYPGNPLDVFLRAAWDANYVSPDRVPPGPLTGTFYVSLSEDANLVPGGDLANMAAAEMVMPFDVRIRNLRSAASLYVGGTCVITLMVGGVATAEEVTISAAGLVEYGGDPIDIPQGQTACLRIATTGFTGSLDSVAITQQAAALPRPRLNVAIN